MDTSVQTQAPAAGPKVPGNGTKAHKARSVKYPIQLRVNLTVAMNESLGRVARHFDCPEGMVGRMALKQFLLSQDAQFRQQLNEANQG